MKTVYLGLGSNIGDREANLRKRPSSGSERRTCACCALSPIYETEPVDYTEQRWFLNLVVEAETELFPLQLLARTAQDRARTGPRADGGQRARAPSISTFCSTGGSSYRQRAGNSASADGGAALRARAAGGPGAGSATPYNTPHGWRNAGGRSSSDCTKNRGRGQMNISSSCVAESTEDLRGLFTRVATAAETPAAMPFTSFTGRITARFMASPACSTCSTVFSTV